MKKAVLSATFKASIIAMLAGCANVDVRRVSDYQQPGIRYWRPAPYLALAPTSANGATACEAKIVMLPDKEEEYAITMNSGLWGSVAANPSLQDGWNLTSLDAKADSKTAETLTAFAAALKAAYPGGIGTKSLVPGQPTPRGVSCGGLYRAEYDDSGRVRGFTEVSKLIVRIPGQSSPAPKPKNPQQPGGKKCGTGGLPPCTE